MVKKPVISKEAELFRKIFVLKARIAAIENKIEMLQDNVLPDLHKNKYVLKETLKHYENQL